MYAGQYAALFLSVSYRSFCRPGGHAAAGAVKRCADNGRVLEWRPDGHLGRCLQDVWRRASGSTGGCHACCRLAAKGSGRHRALRDKRMSLSRRAFRCLEAGCPASFAWLWRCQGRRQAASQKRGQSRSSSRRAWPLWLTAIFSSLDSSAAVRFSAGSNSSGS